MCIALPSRCPFLITERVVALTKHFSVAKKKRKVWKEFALNNLFKAYFLIVCYFFFSFFWCALISCADLDVSALVFFFFAHFASVVLHGIAGSFFRVGSSWWHVSPLRRDARTLLHTYICVYVWLQFEIFQLNWIYLVPPISLVVSPAVLPARFIFR